MEIFNLGPLEEAYSVIRGIFILLNIALFTTAVFAFFELWSVRPRIGRARGGRGRIITVQKEVYTERWRSILRKFNASSADTMRLAIIEADALVDKFLKQVGFSGDTLADRLGRLEKSELQSLGRLWEAHRLRNTLVHAPEFKISAEQAEKALRSYEEFFKELGIF